MFVRALVAGVWTFAALSTLEIAALQSSGNAKYYDNNGNETDEGTAKNTVINNTYNYYGDKPQNQAAEAQPQAGEGAMEMETD